MIDENIRVSQSLSVTCFYVSGYKDNFTEAIHLIDETKNPILHRFVSMNSTK
jgi:hypothetical protein